MIAESWDEENVSQEDQLRDLANLEPSAGPLPNDRKLSTTTQEAIYIYQTSTRAAERIAEENFRSHQLECRLLLPPISLKFIA